MHTRPSDKQLFTMKSMTNMLHFVSRHLVSETAI